MKKFSFIILGITMFFCVACTTNEVKINNNVEVNNEAESNKELEQSENVEPSKEPEPTKEPSKEPEPTKESKPSKESEPSKEPEPSKELDTDDSTTVLEELNSDAIIPEENDNGITILKFKNTNSHEAISALNGKKVSITGYLSTLSPLNGKFAYLMNMPYQNCPYCVPGTSAITNTLTIVAKENNKIEFTDQPVTVTGTLEIGEFKDDFGYEYGVRLNNVEVSKANIDELSENIKKYNLLAENGVVEAIYNSIMIADRSVFYNYYKKEVPALIKLEKIETTKTLLDGYNTNNEYAALDKVMTNLIKFCNTVNSDINSENYENFKTYQNQLRGIYSSFARWMAQGEL